MNCTNHPDVEAQGVCAYCGKPFCKDCLVEVKGRMYCKPDLEHVLDEAKQTANAQPTINITNTNTSANTNVNTNVNGFGLGPTKKKLVAFLWCLLGLCGLAGLHRIYVGKVGTGILYFFTCGLFGIGTVVDLISILVGGFKDKYGFPLI